MPGTLSLRKLIAGDSGFDPNEVCVTAGTEEALFSIFQAYVDPGDEVLVPESRLPRVRDAGAHRRRDAGDVRPRAARLARRRRCAAKENHAEDEADRRQLAVESARLRDRRARRCERSPTLGPLVVSDEVYREIWYDAPPPSMLGLSDNVIVVGGMSKSHAMTGLRLGWVHRRARR